MSLAGPPLKSAPASIQDWREVFDAAMSETDRERLSSLIKEAEAALAHRTRELLAASRGKETAERDAVDRALYKLRALSYCLNLDNRKKL